MSSTSPTPLVVGERGESESMKDYVLRHMKAFEESDIYALTYGAQETDSNAALIIEAVNAYEAAKARIALLEGLLRESRDSVKYVLNRFDAKGSFSGRIQQEDLLKRIDAVLKTDAT